MESNFNPKTEIKVFLEEHKEEFRSDYSINSLESYAQKLIDIIQKWNRDEQTTFEKSYTVRHYILNFKSDFRDALPNNYDNKKKDHREKWTIQKKKIDDLKLKFLEIYNAFNNK